METTLEKKLDLDLSQPALAKLFGVQTDTVTNWELNRNKLHSKYIPDIINFIVNDLDST